MTFWSSLASKFIPCLFIRVLLAGFPLTPLRAVDLFWSSRKGSTFFVIGLLPNKTHSDLAGHGMCTECVTRAHHTCSALRVTRELLFLNRNDQSPRLACTHPRVEKIVTFLFLFSLCFSKTMFLQAIAIAIDILE